MTTQLLSDQRFEEARLLCRLLSDNGYPSMLAGGCVRDRLFGLEPKDYDLATCAPPATGLAFFEKLGYRVIPTGLAHGTITVLTPTQSVEITTLRSDVACFGRHARVAFSTSFEEDARRRDFTINALFEDAHGQVLDFVGGISDLRERRLRFVGDPRERIREDYLRILRYFRFLGRYGWEPQTALLETIASSLDGLKLLSPERIHGEFDQILLSPHIQMLLALLDQTGVLRTLFPWYDATPSLGRLLHELNTRDTTLPWFSLFYWGSRRAQEAAWLKNELARWRFTRKQRGSLLLLQDLFLNLQSPTAAPALLLRLAERTELDLDSLAVYLQRSRRIFKLDPPAFPEAFITHLSGRNTPPIPTAALLKVPRKERNRTVTLIKIFCFSDPSPKGCDIEHIIRHRDQYWGQLASGKWFNEVQG